MKFDSVLKSDHDLKKNGYKIFRKLHKMESKKGTEIAYVASYEQTYFFVLGCIHFVEICKLEYQNEEPYVARFYEKCNAFLTYLQNMAMAKSRMNRTVLASFLRSYTKFFNKIVESKHKFVFDQRIIELWNLKCLMAYNATWGMDR